MKLTSLLLSVYCLPMLALTTPVMGFKNVFSKQAKRHHCRCQVKCAKLTHSMPAYNQEFVSVTTCKEQWRLPLISLSSPGGFMKARLHLSQTLSELSLFEPVRHSSNLAWTIRTAQDTETRTMGWQGRGWLVCACFLGFVASVQSITRDELFPFGPSARDQLLEPGNDQTHQLDLDNPVYFYDGTFDSIFVS